MHLPWLGLFALAVAGCVGLGRGADLMGCLLDASICEVGEECYDDRVFGHCFNPLQKRRSEMKQYRWFDKADVDLIEEYLTTLFQLGYYWDDPFMQCVIRVMLSGIQTQTYTKDFSACKALRGYPYSKQYTNEVGGGNDLFEDRGEAQPYEASIRFSPPSGQFADEVFYPSDASAAAAARTSNLNKLIMSMAGTPRVHGDVEDEGLRRGLAQGLAQSKRDGAKAAKGPKQDGNRAMRKLMNVGNGEDGTLPFLDRRRIPIAQGPARGEVDNDASAISELAMMLMEAEQQAAEAQAEAQANEAEGDEDLHMFSAHYNTPTSFRQGLEYRGEALGEADSALPFLNEDLPEMALPRVVEADDEPLMLEDVWDMQEAPEQGPWSGPEPAPRGFSKLYNTPDSFRAGLETKDVATEPGLSPDQEDDGEGDVDPEVWMDTDVELGGYQRPLSRVPLSGGPVFIRPNRRGSADEEAVSSVGQPEREEQLVQQSQPSQSDAHQQQEQQQQAGEERAEEADQAMKELSHLLERYPADERNSVPDEILAEEGAVDRAGPGAMGRAYTEGGLVFLPDQQTDRPETLEGRSLDALLKEWRGFERQERLDVKKPGPSYNVNNFYFQRDHEEEKRAGKQANEVKGEPRYEAIHASPPHKRPPYSDDMEATRSHNIVSVKFKNGITLGDAVSFKVNPATSTLNASEVARQIMENKEEIKKRTSVDITSATAGRTMPLVQSSPSAEWHGDALLMGSVVLGVTLSAAVISAVTYYAVQRVQRSREKLRGMAARDTEASKDYQDLCRARMAKKAENEARAHPDPMHVDQRLASLSRESEGSNNSPSSRSSTSSWTEEPALTNMDISTGHMVLAYMEDHLKNKDRLEQEWQGLCAYEAEPCAATVAQKTENTKKNRYFPHVLPYDHSRVVLNELANATGSDYINASTITDHDPRNPAYLATQGPLPHTAADLWQLVWEQGSVVMVMLSRLTENGTAMCHRYWPEEGSELYHIYEVHLVSEHIWCDDYLVRSFYLKNLKTGETRTVTQFHFLSWPDHGVPPNTKPLLDFRRKVNKSYRGRSCPIVVHCSDGAGRTGTYCLIDMVLNRMAKGAKEIDIAATLEHIRDQRANMVESKEQFEFCLQAVADEVHAILKALPAQPTPPPTAVAPPPTSPEKEKEKTAKEQPKKKT